MATRIPKSQSRHGTDDPTQVDDRREFTRAQSGEVKVQFKVCDDEQLLATYKLGRSRDISFGGIRLQTHESMEVGSLLAMELEVPNLPQAVTALGSVTRVEEDGDSYLVAVEFLWTGADAEIHEGLRTFVKDRLLLD